MATKASVIQTSQDLNGRRVAILVTDGFEQIELVRPKDALEKAGAETEIIAPSGRSVIAWNMRDFGDAFDVDVLLRDADPRSYDALLLPGGVMSPDKLRMNENAVQFVRSFFEQGKPVAAICHGPQMLIEAGVVNGRTLTSFPSLKTDLRNAGAKWVDETVVVDNGLVTSRKPGDLPAFNARMIDLFAAGQTRAR
jgi:protease I